MTEKKAKKPSLREVQLENNLLRHVIREIQWMARRYAHGRMTYAVGMYNNAIKVAQSVGMEFKPDPIDGLVEAKDGMFDKEWFENNKDKT